MVKDDMKQCSDIIRARTWFANPNVYYFDEIAYKVAKEKKSEESQIMSFSKIHYPPW